ncbi:hypothetical protein AGMMS49574_30100 [Bacteroidia bacterium]|nr:hypothetical protein AGMMS49574_30100 [Bacteroidia bacterium]
MPEAHFAVVIGTGFAFSHFDTGRRICVVEGGEFTPFDVMNVIDTEMWLNEEPRGRRAAEKMISGKYLWKNIWLQRQRQSAGESSPEPYSENLIPILSQQHDLLTIAAVRRSGTLVGSMLKSFCPQDTNDPIRIIADGTVIQSLPEIRLSIEKALDPHPVILILQHDAAIYGSAKAALSS